MRHQRKRHKLGRNASHRKATLVALSNALIERKRITTTVPRAKALRVFIEPIITRAKEDSQHNRRQAFRHLRDKQAVTTLFTEVADKIRERPGGYTRVVRIGRRAGDAAPMAVIELVDYNETDAASGDARKSGKRTRRGRRRGARSVTPEAAREDSVGQGAAPEELVQDAAGASEPEAAAAEPETVPEELVEDAAEASKPEASAAEPETAPEEPVEDAAEASEPEAAAAEPETAPEAAAAESETAREDSVGQGAPSEEPETPGEAKDTGEKPTG